MADVILNAVVATALVSGTMALRTRRETDPAGFKKFRLERRTRRKNLRELAKKNGHKLGHNSRKCKRCGTTRNNGQALAMFGTACAKAA